MPTSSSTSRRASGLGIVFALVLGMLRVGAMLGCLSAVGCLYAGSVNHAPEPRVQIEGEWKRGAEITLNAAQSTDPDGQKLVYRWRVVIDPPVPSAGPAQPSVEWSSGGWSADAVVYAITSPGTYRVALEARDPRGAVTVVESTHEVPNNAPEVRIAVRAADGASAEAGEGVYRRDVALVADVSQSADEDSLVCQGGAKVEWTLLQPSDPAQVLVGQPDACRGGGTLTRYLLRLAPGRGSTEVVLEAAVTDRWGAVGRAQRRFIIGGTPLPCIAAANRGFEPASGEADELPKTLVSYSPGQLTRQAQGSGGAPARDWFVAENTHPAATDGLTFQWAMSARPDGPFVPLARQPGRSLVFPSGLVLPGQPAYLRLSVDDQVGAAAEVPCDVAQPRCGGPGLLQNCYRWVTWEVVAR